MSRQCFKKSPYRMQCFTDPHLRNLEQFTSLIPTKHTRPAFCAEDGIKNNFRPTLPEVDEISQPLLSVLAVGLGQVGGHVEGPLSQKRLRVGRHVAEIVPDDEHLDNGAQGVEEGHLDGTLERYSVPLLAQVDVP